MGVFDVKIKIICTCITEVGTMLKPRFDPLRFSRPNGPTQQERRRMIAEAAYHRAHQRGFVGGNEVSDWLAAEAEVDFSLSFQSTQHYD